jgi:hypothetical protein
MAKPPHHPLFERHADAPPHHPLFERHADAPPRRAASSGDIGIRHIGSQSALQWPLKASAYRLLERCGSGANSVVYRALCTVNSEEVAAKVVDLERIADPAEMEMLAREARAMQGYQHPHVLRLHCSFVAGQQLWLVMPFMEVGGHSPRSASSSTLLQCTRAASRWRRHAACTTAAAHARTTRAGRLCGARDEV